MLKVPSDMTIKPVSERLLNHCSCDGTGFLQTCGYRACQALADPGGTSSIDGKRPTPRATVLDEIDIDLALEIEK